MLTFRDATALMVSKFDRVLNLDLDLDLDVWGAAKTVHMGQNKHVEMTTWSYFVAFPEQFDLYFKVLALLVPEI